MLLLAPAAGAALLLGDAAPADPRGELRFELNELPVVTAPEQVRERVAANFQPLDGGQIDFGFTHRTVWLYLPLAAAQDSSGHWVLALNTRFMNQLTVYLHSAAGWQTLLHNDENSSFDQRPIDYRLLAVPLALAPGEPAELLIGYRSRGTTFLPLAIESEDSFARARISAVAQGAGFYTAAGLMLVYGLFQWLLLGNRIHLHYSVYLGAATLYVFHMDGLSFQYLWPHSPHWNAFAALPLGLAINVTAGIFARQFLRTWETAPRFDRAILAIIALSFALLLWGLLVEDLQVKRAGFWLSSAGALIFLAAGVNARLRGQRYARFYIAGWVGMCLAAASTSLIHSVTGVLPVALSFDITKAGILFDALMFGMAMADQAVDIRRQRDLAVTGQMAALAEQVRARDAQRLAEQGREDALRLAREKSLQLASASHDIRQPLASLKLALGAGGGAGKALESIEYLDALVSGYLDSARDEAALTPVAQANSVTTHVEPFPIQLVLDAVIRMFQAEARAKGVVLRCRPSPLVVLGEPLATVRVVSNLVSNAIKHSKGERVLIGCRRRGGECVICVLDSGEGFPAGRDGALLEAFAQGDDAGVGHGLGLHIVEALCARLGYRFSIRSRQGGGGMAMLALPLSSESAVQVSR